jgi:phosphoglycolate phosphatase-like HAD superfamily hydrolase
MSDLHGNSPAPRVLFWDIDGTLLHTHGAGRRAFERTIEARLDRPGRVLDAISFAGTTDLMILDELRAQGPDFPADFCPHAFFSHMAEEMEAALRETPPAVLPGVVEVIHRLQAEHAHVHHALLTGNTAACAAIKLRHAGLAGRFVFGAYGDEHAVREEIARLALRRARERVPSTRARLLVIGDTPRDVAAARAIEAACLGVGTGPFTAADLRAAGADHAREDLSSVDEVVAWLASF